MNEDIHLAANAIFSAYTYTTVYASVGASPTINDVVVVMVAGSSIKMIIKKISPTPGIYVLGRPKHIVPKFING